MQLGLGEMESMKNLTARRWLHSERPSLVVSVSPETVRRTERRAVRQSDRLTDGWTVRQTGQTDWQPDFQRLGSAHSLTARHHSWTSYLRACVGVRCCLSFELWMNFSHTINFSLDRVLCIGSKQEFLESTAILGIVSCCILTLFSDFEAHL